MDAKSQAGEFDTNGSCAAERSAHQAACLAVVGEAIVRARYELRYSKGAGDPLAERLFLLMDAVHNLPGSATDPRYWDSGRVLRELERYDECRFPDSTYPSKGSLQSVYQDAFAVALGAAQRAQHPNAPQVPKGSAKQEQQSLAALKASSSFPRSADERSAESSAQPIRDAYRSLPRAHRARVAVLAFGLSLGLLLALVTSIPRHADGCDDTMFIAAHPQLAAISGSSAEAIARRFVVLMREVSASSECNERALREAHGLASADVMQRFADELMQKDGVDRFRNRRHSELVTIDLKVEAKSPTIWDLRWSEHVRSPAGVELRTEAYGGELRTSEGKDTPEAIKVADYRVQPTVQPYGYR
jgi:hypothetical protein